MARRKEVYVLVKSPSKQLSRIVVTEECFVCEGVDIISELQQVRLLVVVGLVPQRPELVGRMGEP